MDLKFIPILFLCQKENPNSFISAKSARILNCCQGNLIDKISPICQELKMLRDLCYGVYFSTIQNPQSLLHLKVEITQSYCFTTSL